MNNVEQNIYSKIQLYRRKYYLTLAVRGLLISLGLTLAIFLVFNTLEYSFHFGSIIRAFLLFIFLGIGTWALTKFVIIPLIKMIRDEQAMSNEEAARQIGKHFPEISDKLLNIIQLQGFEGALVQASISQKAQTISTYNFTEAVDVKKNRSYVKYLALPLVLLLSALIIRPSLITSSSNRIIKFNQEFIPEAPFLFKIQNNPLIAFKNEDFTLNLKLEGEVLPSSAFLEINNRLVKLEQKNGNFEYTFSKIQDTKTFRFQAAGFHSKTYEIQVVERPNIKSFNVYLEYPQYLRKQNDRLNNTGNLQIPEGTNVKWQFKTIQSEELTIGFDGKDSIQNIKSTDNQIFEYENQFFNTQVYSLNLKNKYSSNKEKILYKIEVINDQYPEIDINTYQDTTLYNYIALGGNISDDYGLSELRLFYQISTSGNSSKSDYKSIRIPISKQQDNQRYYYQWFLDSLGIKKGNSINYYLQVWDNDGVNGRKASKTGTYSFKLPTKAEIKDQIEKTNAKTEQDIDKTIKDAKDLKKKISEAENRLKGKKDLNWQEENLLKDIIKKRDELNKSLEELKKQNKDNQDKRNRFTEQDQKIAEKTEQLQKLMDELLDEETKKLYEELKKLLEDKKSVEDIQSTLDQIDNKENNLEQELERTLELFKRMKFDQKMDDALNNLEEQIKKQEELEEQTSDKDSNEEDLAKQQEELQKEFEEFQKEKEELEEMNQELKNPESLPDTQEEEQQIKEEQEKAKESLEKNKRNKASQSQQNAKQQMQKMQQKMQQMQSSMEMTMMQENLDDLRDIIHNLLKLSFDQENLMNEFREVKQSDPRFVELGQIELKLKDDAQIVQDSLLALSKRVFQIATFVTRELGEMNAHMDNSVDAIRERKKPVAVSEQQFAMTSMNNLALLLDDVLQQMMDAMQDAMGTGQSKQKGKQKSPSLSELQKELNNKISELKKSGKTGRQMSEELAKLAAQQEQIRRQIQEMQEKFGGEGGKPGNGIPEKMEETEKDLVNKNITQETINRQQDILTRLLESEDAMREREQDEERKAESGKDYEKALPKAFEEYFKLKEKEIELLKTVPPKLYPYYKKEVNEYFKRIGNEPNN